MIFIGNKLALADTLSDCNGQAAEINKSAPQQIDKITILTNAI